jgi:magnesium-transporting ATPase (P-type)
MFDQDFISYWGSLASLISLLVWLISFIWKSIRKLKLSNDAREKEYIDLENDISNLMKKGTNFQRRAELFSYVSALININKTDEFRLRADMMYSNILFLFLTLFSYLFFFKEKGFFIVENNEVSFVWGNILIAFGLLLNGMVNYVFSKNVKHLEHENNVFSDSFLDSYRESIKIKYELD